MPSYDMHCTACDATFELFRQRFLIEDDMVCPDCGGAAESLLTGFVTARPARGDGSPTVRSYAGHGGGCSCCSGAHPSTRAEWTSPK